MQLIYNAIALAVNPTPFPGKLISGKMAGIWNHRPAARKSAAGTKGDK